MKYKRLEELETAAETSDYLKEQYATWIQQMGKLGAPQKEQDFLINALKKQQEAISETEQLSREQAEELLTRLVHNVYPLEVHRDIAAEGGDYWSTKSINMRRQAFGDYIAGFLTIYTHAGIVCRNYPDLIPRLEKMITAYAKETFPAPKKATKTQKNKKQTPPPDLPPTSYGLTLQGVLVNQLRQIGKRTGSDIAEGDTLIFNGENVKLAFFKSDQYKGVAMTVPMQKVLSMYHEELCKKLPLDLEELGKITLEELDQYSKVTITLDKYMELTGTKDKKTARATIKDACDRLFFLSFVVTTKGTTYRGRLFSSMVEISYGGKFEMSYTPDYLRYCATTHPAAFHKGMYKINGKLNPYSWGIGEKLWQHYMLNRGKASGGRLSVKKLLEAVPDIPRYEEVMEGTGAVNQRIIEPVKRDLDELQRLGVLKSWRYSKGKGVALSAVQLENMDYNTWGKLYISFVLDLPPQDKYIEAYKKRLAAATKETANR